MSDMRAAGSELRFLEEKSKAGGLTPAEEVRLQELRQQLGMPTDPYAPAYPAQDPYAAWPAPGTEGAAYDPYAPNASATGGDPYTAQAYAHGGEAQPYEPSAAQAYAQGGEAQPYDPYAAQAYAQGGEAQPYDPYAPQAYAHGGEAQPYDPYAPQAWAHGGEAQPYEPYAPQAYAHGGEAQPYDPYAPQAWAHGGEAQPYEPYAAPAQSSAPYAAHAGGQASAPAPAYDPYAAQAYAQGDAAQGDASQGPDAQGEAAYAYADAQGEAAYAYADAQGDGQVGTYPEAAAYGQPADAPAPADAHALYAQPGEWQPLGDAHASAVGAQAPHAADAAGFAEPGDGALPADALQAPEAVPSAEPLPARLVAAAPVSLDIGEEVDLPSLQETPPWMQPSPEALAAEPAAEALPIEEELHFDAIGPSAPEPDAPAMAEGAPEDEAPSPLEETRRYSVGPDAGSAPMEGEEAIELSVGDVTPSEEPAAPEPHSAQEPAWATTGFAAPLPAAHEPAWATDASSAALGGVDAQPVDIEVAEAEPVSPEHTWGMALPGEAPAQPGPSAASEWSWDAPMDAQPSGDQAPEVSTTLADMLPADALGLTAAALPLPGGDAATPALPEWSDTDAWDAPAPMQESGAFGLTAETPASPSPEAYDVPLEEPAGLAYDVQPSQVESSGFAALPPAGPAEAFAHEIALPDSAALPHPVSLDGEIEVAEDPHLAALYGQPQAVGGAPQAEPLPAAPEADAPWASAPEEPQPLPAMDWAPEATPEWATEPVAAASPAPTSAWAEGAASPHALGWEEATPVEAPAPQWEEATPVEVPVSEWDAAPAPQHDAPVQAWDAAPAPQHEAAAPEWDAAPVAQNDPPALTWDAAPVHDAQHEAPAPAWDAAPAAQHDAPALEWDAAPVPAAQHEAAAPEWDAAPAPTAPAESPAQAWDAAPAADAAHAAPALEWDATPAVVAPQQPPVSEWAAPAAPAAQEQALDWDAEPVPVAQAQAPASEWEPAPAQAGTDVTDLGWDAPAEPAAPAAPWSAPASPAADAGTPEWDAAPAIASPVDVDPLAFPDETPASAAQPALALPPLDDTWAALQTPGDMPSEWDAPAAPATAPAAGPASLGWDSAKAAQFDLEVNAEEATPGFQPASRESMFGSAPTQGWDEDPIAEASLEDVSADAVELSADDILPLESPAAPAPLAPAEVELDVEEAPVTPPLASPRLDAQPSLALERVSLGGVEADVLEVSMDDLAEAAAQPALEAAAAAEDILLDGAADEPVPLASTSDFIPAQTFADRATDMDVTADADFAVDNGPLAGLAQEPAWAAPATTAPAPAPAAELPEIELMETIELEPELEIEAPSEPPAPAPLPTVVPAPQMAAVQVAAVQVAAPQRAAAQAGLATAARQAPTVLVPPPPAPAAPPPPAPRMPGPTPSARPANTVLPQAAAVPAADDLGFDIEEPETSASFIAGEHRVILHTMEGQVKRGILRDVDLGAGVVPLEQQTGLAPERIATQRVKAIFFMLTPGQPQSPAAGQKIRVTFHDGRQLAGFSSDHRTPGPGFFLVPADNRTNTERIYIFRSAVQAVAEG